MSENNDKDKKTGLFLPGNQAWTARSKHGVDHIFKTPADLWAACVEYFLWAQENPLYGVDVVKYMGDATLQPVPKLRMLTVASMCIFMGTPKSTWYTYRNYPAYRETCLQAEEVIYEQKISGAAADLLNTSIIQRHLGLTDKQDINQSGGTTNKNYTITIVKPTDMKEIPE